MNPVSSDNPLANMLDNAFGKLDRNKDDKLDANEYGSFYEILKAGIAQDKNGKSVISEQDYFQRMDHNGDGAVTQEEMQTTGVIMPADLCDESLGKMIDWLQLQKTTGAQLAAQLLTGSSTGAATEKKV